MQALVIREYGPPDVLRLETVSDPKPKAGDVVIELKAAGLNRRDLIIRSGVFELGLPIIPGSDGAGTRRDTGEEIVILPSIGWGQREEAPREGFRQFGGPDDGTCAELIVVPEENVFPRPRRLSWEEVAALPVAGLTAYRALFTRARLSSGESVLVLGAGSGVGTLAIALACQAGARVLVTSKGSERCERARALGAEHAVDYTDGDWVEEVRSLTSGEGVDVVLDAFGSTWPDSVRCLRPGGRAVVFGAFAGDTVEPQLRVELEAVPFQRGAFLSAGNDDGQPA